MLDQPLMIGVDDPSQTDWASFVGRFSTSGPVEALRSARRIPHDFPHAMRLWAGWAGLV